LLVFVFYSVVLVSFPIFVLLTIGPIYHYGNLGQAVVVCFVTFCDATLRERQRAKWSELYPLGSHKIVEERSWKRM
jgi:hypothetical protein